MSWIKEISDDIKNIKSERPKLREFGLTIGAVFAILFALTLWRGRSGWPYFLILAAVFIAFGIMRPSALKMPQRAWMAFSMIIGFFVSRLVLAAVFYIIITPIGLAVKISGRDILDERIDKGAHSYWAARSKEERPREYYENQY